MLFFSLAVSEGVSISIDLATLLVFLLDDLDVFVDAGIALHSIPHSVGLVVDVVDSISVHFGASVDDLARSNPLLVVFLLSDECLHIFDIPKVVHLEGILGVDFLIKSVLESASDDERRRQLTFWAVIAIVSWKTFWKSDLCPAWALPVLIETEMPETSDLTDLLSLIVESSCCL